MSDDGVGTEAYYHELQMRKFRLILLLSVQDGGNGRDYLCGLNEADFMFLIRMSDDSGGGAKHMLMRKLTHFLVVCTRSWR